MSAKAVPPSPVKVQGKIMGVGQEGRRESTHGVDLAADRPHQSLKMTSQHGQIARVEHQSSPAATGMTTGTGSSGAGVADSGGTAAA